MLKKRIALVLLFGVILTCEFYVFVLSAFALSDTDYAEMMKDSAFSAADKSLAVAWNEAKSSLSADELNALRKEQRLWIRTGRDNRAKALMESGLSRTAAFAQATNERTVAILGMLVDSETINAMYNVADLNNAEDYSDFPNDLPDLPDLPDDTPQSKPSTKAAGTSKQNISNPDKAADALMDFLYRLDRVSPGDYLSDLDTQTEIGGETCREFAMMSGGLNMMMESGRYAISPSGKVYEMENDKYVPLNAAESKAPQKAENSPEINKSMRAKGSINGNKVNVRRQPSTKAPVVKQLNAGHPVDVLESRDTDSGRWYHVKTASGTEGWVFKDYVNIK